MQQHEGSLSETFYCTHPVRDITRNEVVTTPASAEPNYLVTHKLRIHRGKTHKQHPETDCGVKEKILSSGTEAAARFPPSYVPSMFPKPSLFWGEVINPAFPKSQASTPAHPHFLQRVSCGVYVTVCPLACKQKAQPKRRGAPRAVPWPQH